MKTLFLIICIIFGITASTQYSIDFKNAPVNPVPVNHHINHFALHGNPISVESTSLNSSKKLSFNPKGNLLLNESNSGGGLVISERFIYDGSGLLKGRRSKVMLDSIFVNYKINDDGFVTEESYPNQPAHLTYSYNNKGLYSKMNNVTKGTSFTYDYDSINRVIIYSEYDVDGKVHYTKNYSYSNMNGYLKIVIVSNRIETDRKFTETRLFDKEGLLIGVTRENDITEPNIKNEVDAHGNYIKQIRISDETVITEQKIKYAQRRKS